MPASLRAARSWLRSAGLLLSSGSTPVAPNELGDAASSSPSAMICEAARLECFAHALCPITQLHACAGLRQRGQGDASYRWAGAASGRGRCICRGTLHSIAFCGLLKYIGIQKKFSKQ